MKTAKYILLSFSLFFFAGCKEHYTPKPKGYFRITFSEKEYQLFDSTYPYRFEYPVYAAISQDRYTQQEAYWMNIDFPSLNAKIYLSYKTVENNFASLAEDSRQLVVKHIPKANGIINHTFSNPANKVYGMEYKILGNEAASPYQFFLTDSTTHFLRGSLYFNKKPNNDSLAPVIDYLIKDVQHLMQTMQWK